VTGRPFLTARWRNLKREVDGEIRCAVVFIKDVVPRPLGKRIA
jgi:hypothetical protein